MCSYAVGGRAECPVGVHSGVLSIGTSEATNASRALTGPSIGASVDGPHRRVERGHRTLDMAADAAVAGVLTSWLLGTPPSWQDFALMGTAMEASRSAFLSLSIQAWLYKSYGCA